MSFPNLAVSLSRGGTLVNRLSVFLDSRSPEALSRFVEAGWVNAPSKDATDAGVFERKELVIEEFV